MWRLYFENVVKTVIFYHLIKNYMAYVLFYIIFSKPYFSSPRKDRDATK